MVNQRNLRKSDTVTISYGKVGEDFTSFSKENPGELFHNLLEKKGWVKQQSNLVVKKIGKENQTSTEPLSFITLQLEMWEKTASPKVCFLCCAVYMRLSDMAYELRKISEV